MADNRSASALFNSVEFQERVEENDGYGNTVGTWDVKFSTRAEYIHLRGSESVMAARLTGKHIQIIRVRNNTATRAANVAWRIRDKRSGVLYNIRDIEHEVNRQFISFTCESGVAT